MTDWTLRSMASFLRDNPDSRVELIATFPVFLQTHNWFRAFCPDLLTRVLFRPAPGATGLEEW